MALGEVNPFIATILLQRYASLSGAARADVKGVNGYDVKKIFLLMPAIDLATIFLRIETT